MSLVPQGLLLRKNCDLFGVSILSKQKEMYDETMSTCSLIFLDGAMKSFQSAASKHPSRLSMLSPVHCLMVLIILSCSLQPVSRLVHAEWCGGWQSKGGEGPRPTYGIEP